MANTPDGGPAYYPSKQSSEQFTYPGKEHLGLSLRDWFAGQAVGMVPAISDKELQAIHPGVKPEEYVTWAARYAFRMADAMLAAREK